jgi:TolB-like protein/Tfp pilus assembly protein PilF
MAETGDSHNLESPAATVDLAPVFISYASHDVTVAQQVCSALEAAGFSCWIAPRDVRPGAQYADAIVGAINEAKAVVLVLSQAAIASSHVAREVERAASKHKPIIAFRIDAAALNRALEYFLSNSQWIDVSALGRPAALAKLSEAVGTGTARTNAVNAEIPAKGKMKRLVALTAAALVVSAAVVVGVHFWSSKHSAAQAPAVGSSEAVAPASVEISDKSIAVLPFADLSEKHDQEYFAAGMAQEITDLLSKMPRLRVVGRASAFQFSGISDDPHSIGAKLGAAYLVEGSVRRSGSRIRVSAQLIDSRDGSQRWSDTYDRDLNDVLAVQDAIAAAAARALHISLTGGFEPRPPLRSSAAYDLYLRGVRALDTGSEQGCEDAIAYFQQALSIDDSFAQAAVGLSMAYWYSGEFAWLPAVTSMEHAREAANKAIQLDPKLGTPHAALAQIHLIYDWDWDGAAEELQRALSLGAGVEGVKAAARLEATTGNWHQASEVLKSGLAIDPLNPTLHWNLAYIVYLRAGRFAEAESEVRQVLEISPRWGYAHVELGLALLFQGRLDEALDAIRQTAPDDGLQAGLSIVYFAMGRKAESAAALKKAVEEDADSWAYGLAEVHAYCGQIEKAIYWLDRAYSQKDTSLYTIKGDPLLKKLERDPRYKAFLRKMRLPE